METGRLLNILWSRKYKIVPKRSAECPKNTKIVPCSYGFWTIPDGEAATKCDVVVYSVLKFF